MSIEVIIGFAIFLVVVLGGGISFVVAIYNGLILANNNVDKTFNNIDVLLQQRHDELPKLVDAVRGYMSHEQKLLKEIVDLRMGYQKATSIDEKVTIENTLNGLLSKLNILVEQYPDLKAIESFIHLQSRVSILEEQVADRRELFNDSINIYNIRIARFPEVLFTKRLNYIKKNYLIIPEEKKQDVSLEFDS